MPAYVWRIAWRLTAKLRRHDPLATRVVLGKIELMTCIAHGIGDGLLSTLWRDRRLSRQAHQSR